MSSIYLANGRIPQLRMLAIVASDTDLDHAIMESCLQMPCAANGDGEWMIVTLLPENGHARVSVFA